MRRFLSPFLTFFSCHRRPFGAIELMIASCKSCYAVLPCDLTNRYDLPIDRLTNEPTDQPTHQTGVHMLAKTYYFREMAQNLLVRLSHISLVICCSKLSESLLLSLSFSPPQKSKRRFQNDTESKRKRQMQTDILCQMLQTFCVTAL